VWRQERRGLLRLAAALRGESAPADEAAAE